jgi:hypothetical protein
MSTTGATETSWGSSSTGEQESTSTTGEEVSLSSSKVSNVEDTIRTDGRVGGI